jgi:hypothetical protein
MLNQYECLTVAADHPSEAHCAPLISGPRRPVPDIAQTTPKSLDGIA